MNAAAKAETFVKTWQARAGSEEQLSRSFWLDLLQNVLGQKNIFAAVDFEKKPSGGKRIDVYLKNTRVLIEQKSRGIDLAAAFTQACAYNNLLPLQEKARHIVTCNFDEFQIYDMNLPDPTHQSPRVLKLENLPNQLEMLQFLVDHTAAAIDPQKEISTIAARLVGKLHAALLKQFGRADSAAFQALNKLCVRLVFCFYAEDSGVFNAYNQFGHYLQAFPPESANLALEKLFAVLNTPERERAPSLPQNLKDFPFVNGALFETAATDEIPPFNAQICAIIINDCSLGFDWSGISPTIFGAMFESTLNPQARRAGGMHYTPPKNIHKVIDPLFLNALEAEFEKCKSAKSLENFQKKLASLTFLDPACGSGNFLTQSYIALRRLENKVLAKLSRGNLYLSLGAEFSGVQVNLSQFFGIEINAFAVSVAKAAMWIAESQMLTETQKILGEKTPAFLPLHAGANIVEANALRVPWENIVPPERLNYIIGNPPFAGFNYQSAEQKAELTAIFPKVKNLDYVCCWFKKSYDFMAQNPQIKTAFVATNSICQGETVPRFWSFLPEAHINFAHRTFKWESEAGFGAAVHVIIVGFSKIHGERQIFLENGEIIHAKNINFYLLDLPNILVKSRVKPICNVPPIINGTKTTDGGNLIIEADEIDDFLKKEPAAAKFIRPFLGSVEFINNKKRFVLWLKNASPAELSKMPRVMERVKKVRNFRLQSKKPETRQRAETPTLFEFESVSETNYLLIPRVSSERRKYIPIGFMPPEVISSDRNHIIHNATLYDFGILTSSAHNAWMKAVGGRLEMRYRYSSSIVYNNFIWPPAAPEHKEKIATLAAEILAVRKKFPDSSLAELYDPLKMPAALLRAHKALDAAVLKRYGLKPAATEPEIVAHLMKLYAQKTGQKWA